MSKRLQRIQRLRRFTVTVLIWEAEVFAPEISDDAAVGESCGRYQRARPPRPGTFECGRGRGQLLPLDKDSEAFRATLPPCFGRRLGGDKQLREGDV